MFNALLPILIKILITSTKSVNNTTKKIAELIPPMTYFSEENENTLQTFY
jgi:hypothetical protein